MQLLATENVRYFGYNAFNYVGVAPDGMRRDFSTCLYARAARIEMSPLDMIIMVVAWVLLATAAVSDGNEQNQADFLRTRAVPMFVPNPRSASSLIKCAACMAIHFMNVFFRIAVPAMIPPALLVLLTTLGAGSTSVILNGLAVGFVLELDNQIPDAFISLRFQEKICAYFEELVNGDRTRKRMASLTLSQTVRRRRPSVAVITGWLEKNGRHVLERQTRLRHFVPAYLGMRGRVSASEPSQSPAATLPPAWRRSISSSISSPNLRLSSTGRHVSSLVMANALRRAVKPSTKLTNHFSDGIVRFFTTFFAFAFGFIFATNTDAGIACEQLIHFFYYRIGVTCCVWAPFVLRELIEGAVWSASNKLIRLATRETAGGSRCEACRRELLANRSVFFGVLGRFTETLACVVMMNLLFWLYCSMYWNNELDMAARAYLWGFVRDLFGQCAASGWADMWGMDCM